MSKKEDLSSLSTSINPEPLPEVPTEYSEGQVAVKKGSGLIKIRKGQSEETYLDQRNQFWETGPLLNTNDWLIDAIESQLLNSEISNLNINSTNGEQSGMVNVESLEKVEKDRIIRGLERLYYLRKYDECLKDCNVLIQGLEIPEGMDLETKKNKSLKGTFTNLESIRANCLSKISELQGTNN